MSTDDHKGEEGRYNLTLASARGEGPLITDARLFEELGEGLNVTPLQCWPVIDVVQVMEEDVSLESQYSDWVRKNFSKVSRMIGMIIDGLKFKIFKLLEEMEQNFTESEKNIKKEKKKQKISKRKVAVES